MDRVCTDVMTGVGEDRPGLAELLSYARTGDCTTVVALDRLGRRLTDIVRTLDTLRELGILVRSRREGMEVTREDLALAVSVLSSAVGIMVKQAPRQRRPPTEPVRLPRRGQAGAHQRGLGQAGHQAGVHQGAPAHCRRLIRLPAAAWQAGYPRLEAESIRACSGWFVAGKRSSPGSAQGRPTSPASVAPLLQVRSLRTDFSIVPVAGIEPGAIGQGREHAGLDVVDQ